MAAAKREVVLAEWLYIVSDGFSNFYACLSYDCVANLAVEQTRNNMALEPEVVLSPLFE